MTAQGGTERGDVEAAIRAAFAGVRLGYGLSLRKAQAADRQFIGLPSLPPSRDREVTDDWSAVPAAELERDCIALLDAEGLRYYLPALMLWLLDRYDDEWGRMVNDGADMAVIGTIRALDQRDPHPRGFLELLTAQQWRAIALFVQALPDLVALYESDAVTLERAWRDVWSAEVVDEPSVASRSAKRKRRKGTRHAKAGS